MVTDNGASRFIDMAIYPAAVVGFSKPKHQQPALNAVTPHALPHTCWLVRYVATMTHRRASPLAAPLWHQFCGFVR